MSLQEEMLGSMPPPHQSRGDQPGESVLRRWPSKKLGRESNWSETLILNLSLQTCEKVFLLFKPLACGAWLWQLSRLREPSHVQRQPVSLRAWHVPHLICTPSAWLSGIYILRRCRSNVSFIFYYKQVA